MSCGAVLGSLFAFGYTPVLKDLETNYITGAVSPAETIGNKYREGFNIIMPLSWIPIIGAIAGIVRIILGSLVIHDTRNSAYTTAEIGGPIAEMRYHGTWSIIRGACEVLTLGFFAPVNILVDVAYSITKKFTMDPGSEEE